jgi:predicted homoserine dehydrogenase-like protein
MKPKIILRKGETNMKELLNLAKANKGKIIKWGLIGLGTIGGIVVAAIALGAKKESEVTAEEASAAEEILVEGMNAASETENN